MKESDILAGFNYIDDSGKTPLIDAICTYDSGQRLNKIKVLLRRGADVNMVDEDGRPPLYHAILTDDLDVVKLLIEKGAKVNNENEPEYSPLYAAVNRGFDIDRFSEKIIRMLMLQGADIDPQCYLSPFIILIAKRCGQFPELYEFILSQYKNADNTYKDGRTLLMKMIDEYISTERVEAFINICSPDLNIRDDDGKTALHYASKKEVGFVKVLIDNGADINAMDNSLRTPLMDAIEMDNAKESLEIARVLLKSGAEIQLFDDEGFNAIHRACYKKRPELLAEILGYDDVDLDCVTKKGDIPIQLVLKEEWGARDIPQEECIRIIDILFQKGVNINSQNPNNGDTALHLCTSKNYTKVARRLIEYGADVNIVNNYDIAPLWLAIDNENVDMVKLLLNCGADVEGSCKGKKPLQLAAERGMKSIVKLLLDNGSVN